MGDTDNSDFGSDGSGKNCIPSGPSMMLNSAPHHHKYGYVFILMVVGRGFNILKLVPHQHKYEYRAPPP